MAPHNDEAFMKVIEGMVTDYANGKPWSVMTFDLLRVQSDTPSMEKAFIMMVSDSDYKTLSLLLQVMHFQPGIKERVYEAILTELEQIKKERENAPDGS